MGTKYSIWTCQFAAWTHHNRGIQGLSWSGGEQVRYLLIRLDFMVPCHPLPPQPCGATANPRPAASVSSKAAVATIKRPNHKAAYSLCLRWRQLGSRRRSCTGWRRSLNSLGAHPSPARQQIRHQLVLGLVAQDLAFKLAVSEYPWLQTLASSQHIFQSQQQDYMWTNQLKFCRQQEVPCHHKNDNDKY
jgi:hypothetical protein